MENEQNQEIVYEEHGGLAAKIFSLEQNFMGIRSLLEYLVAKDHGGELHVDGELLNDFIADISGSMFKFDQDDKSFKFSVMKEQKMH